VNWEYKDESTFGFENRVQILKPSNRPVHTNIFQREEYNGISGIIFSRASVREFQKQPGEDFIFIHNPLAINKLYDGWLGIGWEYKFENNFLMRRRL
jgi:hypothetical protein